MNRVKSILAMLKRRSLPLRGEQSWFAPGFGIALIALLISLVGIGAAARTKEQQERAVNRDGSPTHSTTIALTSDETRVVVVNREANSRLHHSSERRATAMTSPLSWPRSRSVRSPAA